MLSETTQLRINTLKSQQQEYTKRRVVLQEKQRLNNALFQEFGIIHRNNLKRTAKNIELQKNNNQARFQAIYDQIGKCQSKLKQAKENTSNSRRLTKVQAEYANLVESLYPKWSKSLERERIKKIKELETTERVVNERRGKIKDIFEKELEVKTLLAQKHQAVKVVTANERAEAMAREARLQELQQEIAMVDQDINHSLARSMDSIKHNLRLKQNQFNTRREELLQSQQLFEPVVEPQTTENKKQKSLIPSYEWQPVPTGMSVNAKLEQKLNSSTGCRECRIPNVVEISVHVVTNDTHAAVSIQKDMHVKDLYEQIALSSGLPYSRLIIYYGNNVQIDQSKNDPITTIINTLIHNRILAKLAGGNAISKKPSTKSESDLKSDANDVSIHLSACLRSFHALLNLIENRSYFSDLRGGKYGLIGGSPRETDIRRCIEFSKSQDRASLLSQGCDLWCGAVKVLVSESCDQLLPFDIYRRGSSMTRSEMDSLIFAHFDTVDSSYQKLWQRLVLHWQWLVRERVLTTKEVVAAFVAALKPEHEAYDEAVLKHVITTMCSLELQATSPKAAPARQSRVLSFDEALGGNEATTTTTVTTTQASKPDAMSAIKLSIPQKTVPVSKRLHYAGGHVSPVSEKSVSPTSLPGSLGSKPSSPKQKQAISSSVMRHMLASPTSDDDDDFEVDNMISSSGGPNNSTIKGSMTAADDDDDDEFDF